MFKTIQRMLRYYDWGIFLAVFVLLILGLLAVYSVDLGRNPEFLLNFKKQMIFGVVGLALMFIFSIIDWRFLKNFSWLLYILGLMALWLVLFLGATYNATKGWFTIGGFMLQPVEFAKVFLILACAAFFSRKGFIPDFKLLLKGLVLFLLYVIPVLLQPDLGGVLVMGVIWFGMLLAMRFPKKYILGLLGIGVLVAIVSWFFVFHDYQRERVLVFLDPARDPLGRSYNISQAMVAIGSGGLWGQGLGSGSQSQLRFLPEAQTDFIFAVLAEELGFAVILVLLAAQVFLFYRIVAVAKRATDNFSLFFLVGVLLLLGTETVANVGMNLGLMPVVGLTLPFVSYGGSSLISKFILLGVVQSIRLRSY